MFIYLVDTENVGNTWINLLQTTTKEDKIITFYTDKSARISFEDFDKIKKSETSVMVEKCYNGISNALDFQLSSALGYYIKESPGAKFVIFSKDTGYDVVVRYWKARGITVSRNVPDSDLSNPQMPVITVENTEAQKENEEYKVIIECFREYTNGIQSACHSLYGEEGNAIFEEIKQKYTPPKTKIKQKERIRNFLLVVFQKNGKEMPNTLPNFIVTNKNKLSNLSKVRNEFVKLYSVKTYNLCKPYLKLFLKVN